jgi:hypothetical protein
MKKPTEKRLVPILLCIVLAVFLTAGCSKDSSTSPTPSTIMVTIAPPSANVQVGMTQQFAANVVGTANTAVIWSIDAGGAGTISAAGLYMAPATMPGNPSAVIRATLVVDPTVSGAAVVTVISAPMVPGTLTVVIEEARSGWIRKPDNSVVTTLPYVGDGAGIYFRGFGSFVISGLPAGAVINSATLDLSNYAILGGDPFGELGKFRVIALHYVTLDVNDYDLAGYDTVYNQNGPAGSNVNVTSAVAEAYANGWSRFQVRMQFQTDNNGDGVNDYLMFEGGNTGTTLTINYSAPP